MASKALIATLDRWFPPRGPCGMCGHKDARHRLWDAIIDSPDSGVAMARNYEIPVRAVRAVRSIRPYRRAKKPQ